MNVKSFAVICALCFSFLACTNKKQQESNLTPGNLLASEVAVGLEVGKCTKFCRKLINAIKSHLELQRRILSEFNQII